MGSPSGGLDWDEAEWQTGCGCGKIQETESESERVLRLCQCVSRSASPIESSGSATRSVQTVICLSDRLAQPPPPRRAESIAAGSRCVREPLVRFTISPHDSP